jgi:hypothetical protein
MVVVKNTKEWYQCPGCDGPEEEHHRVSDINYEGLVVIGDRPVVLADDEPEVTESP